jgi:shikimate kinase
VLVGFMGAGKTTTGRLLAARLGVPFRDSDQVIVTSTGRSIADIFAEDGEPAFRALEAQTIAELAAGPRIVLALGGGAVEHEGTRMALRGAAVVHLHVSYRQSLERVGGDARRPMLARPDLDEVYARRVPLYASVATLTVPTDGQSLERVVAVIAASLAV